MDKDKTNIEGTEVTAGNVIKGDFEKNVERRQFAGIVVNVNRFLSLSLDKHDDLLTISTHVNGHVTITRPAHHDEMSMFSASGHMQRELHSMIVKYEPWRQWDNALFTPRMEAEVTDVEQELTKKYPVPHWDQFMRYTRQLVNLIRDSLNQHFGGDITVWTLPRETDDELAIQARRIQPDGKEQHSMIIKFLPSMDYSWSVVEVTMEETDGEPVTLPKKLYLDSRKTLSEQVEALAGLLCMDEHDDQVTMMRCLADTAGL